ncbi:MAG: hypothetical protein SVX38_09185 [Chloroflexota bacterium]|nr:hypothetical protein [Chloroflexota bacterium]
MTRLLKRLNFSFPPVVASVASALVTKDEYASGQVPDGVEVKVLHMVARG